MNRYREEMNTGAKESRWTFFRFLSLILGVVMVVVIYSFALRSAGLIGRIATKREVSV